jgi:hypothetical protein
MYQVEGTLVELAPGDLVDPFAVGLIDSPVSPDPLGQPTFGDEPFQPEIGLRVDVERDQELRRGELEDERGAAALVDPELEHRARLQVGQ